MSQSESLHKTRQCATMPTQSRTNFQKTIEFIHHDQPNKRYPSIESILLGITAVKMHDGSRLTHLHFKTNSLPHVVVCCVQQPRNRQLNR
jgi:hypothetical protein